MERVDIVIRNGQLVSVATREILAWDVAIQGDRIAYVGPNGTEFAGPKTEVIDADGQFLVPGLISAHDHYEMTLMSAVPFAEAVLPQGTTAAIMDPHDIVNVLGMDGMRLLIEESRSAPLKAFFMVPPCVPPAPGLEDAGCELRLEDVRAGLRLPCVLGLAEAMDFTRIIRRETEMMRILDWARTRHLAIDGHCPEVRGADLCRYIAPGPIRTDHESTTVEEQIEKLRHGMTVILRRGSIEEPMSAGDLVARVNDTSGILLSVDGCASVEDILEHGHMRWAVRQVIAEGVEPLVAIQMATINVARCYGLDHQIGMIAPGRCADIVFVRDLEAMDVTRVMVDGKSLPSPLRLPRFEYPAEALTTIKLDAVSVEDLIVHAPEGLQQGPVHVRTIGVADGALTTDELIEDLVVRGGVVEADPRRDILKVAVFERYGRGSRAIGFVRGFGLREGAFAGSVGQDSQNVVGVGASDTDLATALNAVRKLNGGVCVAHSGGVTTLPLPIAGIMTEVSPAELAAGRAEIIAALRGLGCQLRDPIFALSLAITLVVIPSLKMSNRGLVDVMSGEIVDLFA